jgi:hypothetical protein
MRAVAAACLYRAGGCGVGPASVWLTWLARSAANCVQSATYHDFHHTRNIGNYGAAFLDCLMGSETGWCVPLAAAWPLLAQPRVRALRCRLEYRAEKAKLGIKLR